MNSVHELETVGIPYSSSDIFRLVESGMLLIQIRQCLHGVPCRNRGMKMTRKLTGSRSSSRRRKRNDHLARRQAR